MLLKIELLIQGPGDVLDEIVTRTLRAGLATRIRNEVLEPFRRIIADEAMSNQKRCALKDDLAAVVIRSCEEVSAVRGIPDSAAADRW